MLTYRPDKFSRAFRHPAALPIWHWLQSEQSLVIMETASLLRRPAVEALAPRLSRRFPVLARSHTLRQMTGHMVRQIMEHHGYHLDRPNVRIVRGLFRRGSTYVA